MNNINVTTMNNAVTPSLSSPICRIFGESNKVRTGSSRTLKLARAGLATIFSVGAGLVLATTAQAYTLAHFAFTDSTVADSAGFPSVTVSDLAGGSLSGDEAEIDGYSTSTAGNPSVTESGAPVLLTSGFVATVPANYRYLTFEMTPLNGDELDIQSFGFWGYTSASSAYDNEYIMSVIVDGTEHTLGSGQVGNTFTQYAFEITPGTYVTSNIAEFRIYGQGFGQFGNDTLRIDDVKVTGAMIPEPSSSALILVGLTGVFVCLRRCPRKNSK